MPDPIDLTTARQLRQERRDVALLELFSTVLRMPLERRELTAEQAACREDRLQARRGRRALHPAGEGSPAGTVFP